MKLFKVQKTDLKLDGEMYQENQTYEFNENTKAVKKLLEDGILVKTKEEAKSEIENEKLLEIRKQKLLETGYTYNKKEKAFAHPVLTQLDPVSISDLEKISDEDFDAALELTKEQIKLIEEEDKK